MAVTQATLVDYVRDLVEEPGWDDVTTASLSTTTAATVTVADTTLYDIGAVLEDQVSGEQVYVTALPSATTLTVKRGYNGTTAATWASGVLIRREPRFTIKRIQNSVGFIANQLWPYAYFISDNAVTPVAGTKWYNLNAADMALASVSQVSSSGKDLYVYGSRGSRMPITFRTNMPAAMCASTNGIMFPRGFFTMATDVRVATARQIDGSFSTGTTYANITAGIPVETIAHGVAARLAYLKELPRDTLDDTGMGDASVPPGARTRVGRDLWAQYIYLRSMWHEQLRRTSPLMGEFHGGSMPPMGG